MPDKPNSEKTVFIWVAANAAATQIAICDFPLRYIWSKKENY